jgi:hypothetical protein
MAAAVEAIPAGTGATLELTHEAKVDPRCGRSAVRVRAVLLSHGC